jgi:hypothetical protein
LCFGFSAPCRFQRREHAEASVPRTGGELDVLVKFKVFGAVAGVVTGGRFAWAERLELRYLGIADPRDDQRANLDLKRFKLLEVFGVLLDTNVSYHCTTAGLKLNRLFGGKNLERSVHRRP